MAIKFAVAKYIPDLMRQEPRNIGIFVSDDDAATVRLLGTNDAGNLDLRKVPELRAEGDLYAEWFHYWTKKVARIQRDSDSGIPSDLIFEELVEEGDMFTVWPGGEYLDAEGLTLDQIADRLFHRLVLSPQEVQRDSEDDESPSAESGSLHHDLKNQFAAKGILVDRRRRDPPVPFPIRANEPVPGSLGVPYKPSFSQVNGRLTVIENLDFNRRGEARLRDQALSTAFMLRDIAGAHGAVSPVELIAVYSLSSDSNFDAQTAGMAALKQIEGIRLFNWDIGQDRQRFLNERVRVAMGLDH